MNKVNFQIGFEHYSHLWICGIDNQYDDMLDKKQIDGKSIEEIIEDALGREQYVESFFISDYDLSRLHLQPSVATQNIHLNNLPRKVRMRLGLGGFLDEIKNKCNKVIQGDKYLVVCSRTPLAIAEYCVTLKDDEGFDANRLYALHDDWGEEGLPKAFSSYFYDCVGKQIGTLYYDSEKQGYLPLEHQYLQPLGKMSFIPYQVSITNKDFHPLGDWCDSIETECGKVD